MIKIKTYTVGKVKEAWLEQALLEYEKRLGPAHEWVIQKTLEPPPPYIALDPRGKLYTSEEFSLLITARARHTFVIGGPDGLSPNVKENAEKLISFSPMVFTHQLTRLVLVEQLYRAFEIARGSPYHK